MAFAQGALFSGRLCHRRIVPHLALNRLARRSHAFQACSLPLCGSNKNIKSNGITALATTGVLLASCLQRRVTRRAPPLCFARRATTRAYGSTSSSAGAEDTAATNPLLASWSHLPFSLPPFRMIEPQHFRPAFEEGMKKHLEDLQRIVDEPENPSFENVIVAYDRAGAVLGKVAAVFGNMCSSLNTPELQVVETDMSPVLSRHRSATYMMPGLFAKVDHVYEQRRDLGLTPEQVRLTERIHMDFSRAGAKFDEESQTEYADIQAKLASLQTEFAQNVLKDEETYEMVLDLGDLTGCPDSLIEAAREAAIERNRPDDQYSITLSRSIIEPFLTFSDRRDLRKQAFSAWAKRGELDAERDNIKIAQEILRLRQKQAQLHGYKTFAEYQCEDRMAKTPANVMALLENVWARAKKAANQEREALEEFVRGSGIELDGGIQPWDWRYYAEQVRKAKYDFDENLLRPYLSLEKVTEAVMSVSQKLFGLRFVKRPDLVSYHPDVQTYEVHETLPDGSDKLVAIFIHDNFARQHKVSGAWMSEYRTQTKNLPIGADPVEGVPVISNNNNFAKGKDTLLTLEDASTLFHEFGHGHHGMLSDATYSTLASTNVLTDFVELPSQLMERWFEEPEVLKKYARHYQSGEEVPDELLAQLKAAKSFNQGFATVEYTICALLDMAMHQIEDYSDFDLLQFEKQELQRLGMPQGIIMRHRPAHFQHLFSTSGYAAGYYVYQWAEVLDADVFAAFKEAGDIFDSDTAAKARKYIYSAGNTMSPDELFRLFRGRDPDISFMLERNGLATKEAATTS